MKKRIVIFPAGTEIGLEINNALKYSKLLEVIGATSTDDHTEYVYSNYFEVPYFTESNFIDKFNEKLEAYNIDMVYPAHDSVLLFLTIHAKEIRAEIITSPIQTIDICRSKTKTYDFFNNEQFVPRVYKDINEVQEYPVFIKPDIGQGSKGAKLISNYNELIIEINSPKDIVICEYLPGEEYTVDCFTDLDGKLQICRIRNRARIKSGISMKSIIQPLSNYVFDIAQKINERLQFNGAWFFQLKKDKHCQYKLLEIAARIPGTMGVTRNLGYNFPLLTIYNMMGIKVNYISNEYNIEVDRALISRYKTSLKYEHVYIDLDDTLILNDRLNLTLIMFLYQAVNQNKKLYLITKHNKLVSDTLKKHKICEGLFDEIISLNQQEQKYKYVKHHNSILIDDSFSERKKVQDEIGIPVFDLDNVECLIDWRI